MFLVTGATGQLGKRIVRLLCQQEKEVRGFVRLTSRYGNLEQRGAQIFIGDLNQEKDIQNACQEIKYVISAHGSGGDATNIDYRANIDLIDAAKASGVEHFVFISVLGTDRGYEDSTVFKAKWEVEKYLKKSGLNYTILRPSALASSLLPLAERLRDTGFYLLIGDPKNRTSAVSDDDVAQIAINSVNIEAAKNQTFAVGGPEIITRGEICQTFSRVFNKEPILINPPLLLFDGIRNVLGFVNPDLQKNLGTLRVLLGNEFFCKPEEIETLETTFGLKMESLENFVRRYLAN